MINLSQIFKTEPQVPMVAAVLVNKAADLNVAKARISKAGFQTETFDDTNDGIVIFPQSDNVKDVVPGKNGAYIIKMDEMISCIVTGVSKSFEAINFDSTSFDEVLSQEGMRPGIHLSMDILSATVSNIFAKAEDRSEMVTNLSKALDEFKSHIVGMAQAVPENAFSIDFFKASDFSEVAKANADSDKAAADKAAADTAAATAAASSGDTASSQIEPAAAAAAAQAAAGEGNSSTENAGDTGVGTIMGQMADLAKSIAALTDLTKATSAKVDAQASQLDVTAALAKSASDAANKIGNTIRGGAGADPNPTEVSKAEAEAQNRANPPLIDTAMGPLN